MCGDNCTGFLERVARTIQEIGARGEQIITQECSADLPDAVTSKQSVTLSVPLATNDRGSILTTCEVGSIENSFQAETVTLKQSVTLSVPLALINCGSTVNCFEASDSNVSEVENLRQSVTLSVPLATNDRGSILTTCEAFNGDLSEKMTFESFDSSVILAVENTEVKIIRRKLWSVIALYEDPPLLGINCTGFAQRDRAKNCGVLALLNLFYGVRSLDVTENSLMSSLKNLGATRKHDKIVSSLTGQVNKGFPAFYFRHKHNLIEVLYLRVQCGKIYEGFMCWRDIITSVVENYDNIHCLYIIGKYESVNNPVDHTISIDLINEVMFDSCESVGPVLRLNLRQLEDKILPFPSHVIGLKLKGEALKEFICNGSRYSL